MTIIPQTAGPGSFSFIAPPAEQILERAKASVMAFYVSQVEKDGVPATQRAMYVMKAMDAQALLDGGQVPSIDAEARIVGVTPRQLAQTIVDMAAQSRAVELQRMRVNTELVEAMAKSPADPTPLFVVLDKYGIPLLGR